MTMGEPCASRSRNTSPFLVTWARKMRRSCNLAVAIGEMADQKDPSIPVDFHFAVAEIWNLHADRAASRSFRDLVYDFLRKRVEDN